MTLTASSSAPSTGSILAFCSLSHLGVGALVTKLLADGEEGIQHRGRGGVGRAPGAAGRVTPHRVGDLPVLGQWR
jgi:hypothetical protein